ncbi:MAG: 3'-5' exonuclease [Candidatus Pacebacteria bacterium]|nr:3'-5' exonuclease [Candidatus Paceibacterota bacterium]
MASNQSRLVFDIETIGEDFSKIDKTTQDNLTNWIKREAEDKDDYERMLDDIKNGLGFSPLTGEIVAIGVLDIDKDKGGVYYQSPDLKSDKFEEDGIMYEPMDEAGILKKFWDIASKYSVFATFNGRAFDVPFIMARSAVKKVKPTKNLMFSRYLYQQHSDSIHIDLCDQLSFQGAVRKKGSLHLWSRALGIKSPKASGITGDDVGFLFKKKKYLDIARYNVGDLKATKELFKVWEEYFNI